jgi:hypothetical protein
MLLVTEAYTSRLHVFDDGFQPVSVVDVPLARFGPPPAPGQPDRLGSLMSVVPSPQGWLACGLSEVLELDDGYRVIRRLSRPWMSDIHYVEPAGEGILVVNTGFEEVLEIGWTGNLDGQRWDLTAAGYGPALMTRAAENRGVDQSTVECHEIHVNYAHRLPDGRLVVSVFKEGRQRRQGAVLLVDRQNRILSRLAPAELEYTHCPVPVNGATENGWWVCSSGTDTVLRLSTDGRVCDRIGGVGFPKCLQETRHGLLIGDVNGKALLLRGTGGDRRIGLGFMPYWLHFRDDG